MSGALNGIRIVDLTAVISGPVATQILADQGAEVIKIEPPGGDQTRSYLSGAQKVSTSFVSSNRNKKSVVLDLKLKADLAKLYRLISTADVFIENFRPGAAERMGLGEDKLRALCPNIIYASINGFGETGPYADKRVYDPIVQATSGSVALPADPAEGQPRMVQFVLADKVTALTAAQAVTAAIVARGRTGEGQSVKISMQEAMLAFLWPSALGTLTLPDSPTKSPARAGKIFKTTDGWITASANTGSEWHGLCAALNRPEWLRDPRYLTPGARILNGALLFQAMQDDFIQNTSSHWLALLDAHDVPCAPILGVDDLPTDPQIMHRGSIEQFDHPEWGVIRQARPAARFSRTPSAIRSMAPSLGQHTDEILAALASISTADKEV